MSQSPNRQQRTDAGRIGQTGTGKLDRDAGGDRNVVPRTEGAAGEAGGESSLEDLRARLIREHDDAVEELRRLGISPSTREEASRAGADSVLDEGDQAQASERHDLGFATRERLAERINRLTAAIRRMDEGTYGLCTVCGGPIEPARLAALPEADTCLRCQEEREQTERQAAA